MAVGSYEQALSVGIPLFLNSYRDNITNYAPTLKAMKEFGGLVTKAGGTSLLCPIRHSGSNVVVVGADPADASTYVNSAVSNQVASAAYNWAELWSGIALADRELNKLKNDNAALAEYISSYTQGSIEDFGKMINTSLHSTGYAYGSETTLGNLQGAIYTTGTLGGIDSSQSGNAFWRSTVTDAASGVASLAMLDSMQATIQSVDGEQPNLIVTTPAIFSKLRSAIVGAQRIVIGANPAKGQLGMSAVEYNGSTIVGDASCVAETIYFINTSTLRLVVSSDAIKVEEFADARPLRQWKLGWHCQLTCSDRKSNGRLHTVKLA